MPTNLQLAINAHQSGNLAEAERLYRDVLAAKPDEADAQALLGVALDSKGEHAQAIEAIEKAIALDPKSALFRLHHGNAMMNADRTTEAAISFGQAILLQPNLPQAHFNFGNALRKLNDWPGAIDAYRKAVQHNPNYAEAYNNLALALVHEKKFDEAMTVSRQAATIAPDFGEAWLTLCNVAEQVEDYTTAVEAGERVTQMLPGDHRAWFGYGVALNRLHRHEDAITAYNRALGLKPDRADIWDNLGQTYQSLNRLGEAEAMFRKCIEVAGQVIDKEDTREVDEKEYGNRHWHLSLVELLQGKYKLGFARYRSRFEDVGGLERPKFPQPVWRGENLTGKTILVCDEQGFGDTLMFCRYLPMMKSLGARVIFSVHPALQPLFARWPGADAIVVHGQKPLPFDYHTTTFDLPHRFGTTLASVPVNVPYLPLLDIEETSRIRDDGRRKVGVVWGGSPLHKNDQNRSIPLQVFSSIFDKLGVRFYSFNRDLKKGDADLLPSLSVVDLAPRIQNFADAARFMRQCDLIITCDTASAHLAGGLGRRVWTLLPYSPDWRWMLERSDSPWYPTMRLFRQTKPGDWEDVMVRVKEALRNWA